MSDDVKAFGQLVRQRREALKLTQEAVAAAVLKDFDRKGLIPRIENGEIPNITLGTVREVSEALSIDEADIPASLRWSDAVDAASEKNATVHETHTATEKVAEAPEKMVALLSAQAKSFKIKEGLLIALARRYAEGSPRDFDTAYAGLENALEVAAQDRDRGKLPSNTDDAVDAVIAQVDALNDAGRIDTAAALLAEEEARIQAGLGRMYDKGIAQAVLTRDVDAVVSYELKKLPLEVEPESHEDAYAYLRSVFIDWCTRGMQQGLNFDLGVAIALMRDMVRRFDHDQDKKGACLTNLSVALATLGGRETGTARLEEAVIAFRSALEERPRDRVPLDWAKTQMNLGTTLWTLGRRETGTAGLEEAVTALRNALEENTRERVPLDWATTQMNLGNALQSLGERETGTGRLEEAVNAYRNALKEFSRHHVPLDWAKTQMNLGTALHSLGERETGTARLEEAVTAYRNALEENTRDRVPLEWAMTQTNLGSALRILAERDTGTERLEGAVTAYRNALEENTRDRVPLDWAMTQMNLGAALQALGERETGTARLEEAVIAYRNALEENTRDRMPLEWTRTQNNLGNALRFLGERETGTARLEEAVSAYRNALEENTRDRVPLDWATTVCTEAKVLINLADRTKDARLAHRALDQLVEAVAILREGGQVVQAEFHAHEIPKAQALVDRLTVSG